MAISAYCTACAVGGAVTANRCFLDQLAENKLSLNNTKIAKIAVNILASLIVVIFLVCSPTAQLFVLPTVFGYLAGYSLGTTIFWTYFR